MLCKLLGVQSHQHPYPAVSHVRYNSKGPRRQVHWCNSGMHVMGETNSFLIGFKDYSTGENSCPEHIAGEHTGPRREPNALIFCQMDIVSECLLNKYFCPQRYPKSCSSVLICEQSLCGGWQLTEKLTTSPSAENQQWRTRHP